MSEILGLAILGLSILLVIIGLIIYGIIVWRRRAAARVQSTDHDPGIGTVRRLYFYLVAFVSLMMSATGIVIVVQFILDSIAGGAVISDSTARLAAGVSILIVGAPLWFFHWRFIHRAVTEQPASRRAPSSARPTCMAHSRCPAGNPHIHCT